MPLFFYVIHSNGSETERHYMNANNNNIFTCQVVPKKKWANLIPETRTLGLQRSKYIFCTSSVQLISCYIFIFIFAFCFCFLSFFVIFVFRGIPNCTHVNTNRFDKLVWRTNYHIPIRQSRNRKIYIHFSKCNRR